MLRTGRVMALVTAIGLVPLAVGTAVVQTQSTKNRRAALDRALREDAGERTTRLENYFERARSIALLTAQNPAFHDFYDLPGSRLERIRRGGPTLEHLTRALAYLERLYPTSIGEACFIDRSGWEIARVVRATHAAPEELSNELGNPFVAPTFALRLGQVYQATPYVSPDTKEWVVSSSTPMPTRDGAKRAIVHFEVTIESFRRTAAQDRYRVWIIDAGTGAVIVDSRSPQKAGAPLGSPRDRRFATLLGRSGHGVAEVAGNRVAFRRLRGDTGNANDWLIVVGSPPIATSAFGIGQGPLILFALALLMIAFVAARRWVRLSDDLDLSQEGLRESEHRYRKLFVEAERARLALAEQNEQLRELDRLKDEFIALVSHELRTPLTSIRGYLEFLLEDAHELPQEQARFLGVVDRNVVRLQHLVNDLLFVAQVDAGRLNIELKDCDLGQLARECIEAARPDAERSGIELDLLVAEMPTLEGDRARLAQLLDNLISNAIKFTPEGGKVEVRTWSEGGRGYVSITDCGIGISEEEQAHLFERFYRATSATEQAIPGTGLGLAIAKVIVDAHGGSIGIQSRVGEGTTFRVELPLAADVEQRAA